MSELANMFRFYFKRRTKDFFILTYNLVLPLLFVLILGYLMEPSYNSGIISSFQYYFIVLIPFFTALSITTSLYNAKEDSRERVSERIYASPIRVPVLIVAKMLSSALFLAMITGLLILVGAFFLKLGNLAIILAMLAVNTVLIFFCTALGYFFGVTNKNEDMIRSYLNLPICIMAFLGGCFFPVGSTNTIIESIIKLSPFYWLNKTVFSMIYDSNYSLFILVTTIIVILTFVFVIFSIRQFNKEAYL